jgi:uncharacterized protein (DUF697 family)
MAPSNFWESLTKTVTDIGEAVGSAASQATQAVAETAVKTGEAISSAASQATQAVAETAVKTGEAVGSAASSTGQAVTEAAGIVGGAVVQAGGTVVEGTTIVASNVGNAAATAGQAVIGTAVGVSGVLGSSVVSATEGVGYAFELLSNNPQFQQITKALPHVDFLVKIIDQVDLVKAEVEVKNLQQQYPEESAGEIAHRLMLNKALLAGTSGFATSITPGAAAALFIIDLSANMMLQAEMIYQIACAYGLDAKDPTRKGEIIAIFGLSLGGSQALKAGSEYAIKAGFVGLLRNAPIAGAVIGASTNAAMIYALGYAACRFYEAKINPLSSQAALEAAQGESDKYLAGALNQQAAIDQILAHVVLAGNSGKSWSQILPELQTLNLSPASLEAIATHINAPPALETLLDQVSNDFAVSLLAQCKKIVELDGIITPEEAQILDKLNKKFNIDLALIKI